MTRHLKVAHAPDSDAHYLQAWQQYARPPRRPAPPALVVARLVYATVLMALVVGLPHLLRGVGAALQ